MVVSEQQKGSGEIQGKKRGEKVLRQREPAEMEESYKGERRAATKGRGSKSNKCS